MLTKSFVNLMSEFVSRKEASEILDISTRTLDRYVAKNIFGTKKHAGKILLNKEDLLRYKSDQNPYVPHIVRQEEVALSEKDGNTGKYKILYEEAKQDLEKKDSLLQQLHYRLGIMETEAKNMVPLLEAENARKDLEEEFEKISIEKERISRLLKITHRGRMFFFFLSLFFFFVVVFLLLQNVTITI